MAAGRLISISGIDGSGKSTQTRLLTETLRELTGEPAVAVKTELSATYSIFALSGKLYGDRFGYHPGIPATLREFTVCCDVLRFSQTTLERALAQHGYVVWDRGPLCYKAYARTYGAQMEWPLALLGMVRQPDLTVLLDIDPTTAVSRIRQRAEKPPHADEDAGFLAAVRQSYLSLSTGRGDVVVIDAARDPSQVHADAIAAVLTRLADGQSQIPEPQSRRRSHSPRDSTRAISPAS